MPSAKDYVTLPLTYGSAASLTLACILLVAGEPRAQGAGPPADGGPARTPRDIGTVRVNGDGGSGTGASATGAKAVTGVAPSSTGSREQAQAAKRLAPNMIEVQPQSEIRKLPDRTVADALARLPGVTLETDTGEGRYVFLRGLEANLNAVAFGGVKLVPTNPSSPFGGGRAIALDTLPSALIGGLQLTKTLRPEQDAEGLGGQINILPRALPTDGRTHGEATILGGAQTLRGTPIAGGDITVSTNFGYAAGTRPWDRSGQPVTPSGDFFTNPYPFSLSISESHFNDQLSVDDFETSYNNTRGAPSTLYSSLDLRRYEYARRRYGRSGEFSYKPNDQNSWYVRLLEGGYNDRSLRRRLILSALDSALPCAPLPGCTAGPGNAGFIAPKARAVEDLRDVDENLRTRVVAFGGENLIAGAVKVDYRGGYVEGSYAKPYDYISTFTNSTAFPLAYDNTTDPQHPSFRTLNGLNLANPGSYTLTGIAASKQEVRDREWSGVVNAATPMDLLMFTGVAKTGVSVRLRQRTLNAPQQTYGAVGATPLSAFAEGGDQIYYDNRYSIGPNINPSVNGLVGTPALFRSNLLRDGTRTAGAQQDNRENVYAWYGQYQAAAGPVELLTGVRVELTRGDYGANTVITRGTTFTVTPSTNHQSYANVFPSVQGTYKFDPTFLVRAAYSTAIGRPGFNQITAATIVDVGAGTVTIGNPDLKPTTANSFDLSIEKYLPYGGRVSLGGFAKLFKNYTLPTTATGSFPGISGVARINSYINGGDATALGIEAGYTQKFAFLPEPFSGFGVDLNYTYVQSAVTLHPGLGDEPLPGTASHNANLALFYEEGPVTFRLAGAYTSTSLFRVGATRELDQFAVPRFRLDASIRYRIAEHLEWFAYGRNLTDAALAYTEGASKTRYVQREFYGASVYSGLKVSF